MEIEQYLEKIGLNQKEASIYLACLELGQSAILPITKKVRLPRTTAFHLLERLEKRKLIEISENKSRRIYSAYPPKNILKILKQEKEKANLEIESFEKVLPELTAIYGTTPFLPKTRIFEGEEIKDIYEEILESQIKEILYVGETKELASIVGEGFLRSFVRRKVEKDIFTRSIRVRSSETKEEYLQPKKEYLREARFAPSGFHSPTHIYIYGDNVAILTSAKENFGFVITSREYAKTMKNWFEQLWNVSKKNK
ncbi:MAG: helix-turn-helix domain-containing protein [Patescibacteria group bacterium]|nr:helix-turn-helix domain-containing protein [Patescibacteria group bacterium]